MVNRKPNPSKKVLMQRVRYWDKQKSIDRKAGIILAISPRYVAQEFKAVKKLHGTKYAVRFLKAKFGKNYGV